MTGLLSGARQAIGQYFSLVSLLPSVLFVGYCVVLFSSGALSGPPDAGRMASALSSISFGDAASLTVLALALAVVMHPLQYSIVQIAEGYWGLGRIGRALRTLAVSHHADRHQAVTQLADQARAEARRQRPDDYYELLLTLQFEAARLAQNYPQNDDEILPTRLGNVLRRYESGAGRPFGLRAPGLMTMIGLVAPVEHVAYLNDRRSSLDLSVRTAVTFALAFVVTVAVMWDDGFWLLTSLIPYGLAYLCYRGAVIQAHDYGAALAAIVAMNRFAVYERLHLKVPDTAGEEKDLHKDIRAMLDFGELRGDLTFDHPPPPATIVVPAPNTPA